MERNAFGVVIVSVEKNDLIALESVLLKRISEECLCLTLMVLWEKLQRVSCFGRFHTSALLIWDLHPQHLMIVMQRHVMGQINYGVITSIIILINDNYTVVTIIKNDEHKQRTATHTNLPNVYPKEAQKFPTPSQFKRIMLKSESKVKLQKKYSIRKKPHFLFSWERGGHCPDFQVKFRQFTPMGLRIFSREA